MLTATGSDSKSDLLSPQLFEKIPFTFVQITPQVAQTVRRYLISTAFRRGEIDLWSEAVQLDFSSLAEGW